MRRKTNVGRDAVKGAIAEAVATWALTPGDTVLADSLDQGWYRVTPGEEVLGYADRSTLAALR